MSEQEKEEVKDESEASKKNEMKSVSDAQPEVKNAEGKAASEDLMKNDSTVKDAVEVKENAEPINHTIRGLVGRKLGMTQIFDKDGNVVPVTLVEAGPCTVLDVIDANKVKIGFDHLKESRINKPNLGYFKKQGTKAFRVTKEFASTDNKEYTIGLEIRADLFKPGDYVDVTGISIGKGFQGGMKRHGWMGGPGGHGSNHHRRVGSIGASADPSRTIKGFPMPGRMGAERVTTQGLRVMRVEADKNLVLIKGSVPGCKNGIVSIRLSNKKAYKSLDEKVAVVKHKVNPMKQSKAKVKGKG